MRFRKLVLLFLLFMSSVSWASFLNELYPSLNYQVAQINDKDIDKKEAVTMLARYFAAKNKDFHNALDMIIQEKIYSTYSGLSGNNFTIDAQPDDWTSVPDIDKDEKGDVSRGNADLIEFSAYLDSDFILYTFHKTQATPKQTAEGEAFLYWIYFPGRKDISLQIIINWKGKYNSYNFMKEGQKTQNIALNVDSSIDRYCEAKVDLKAIFKKHGIPLDSHIQVRGGMYHPKIKGQHDTGAILDLYAVQHNYALELLLYLFSKGVTPSDDNIPFALALANNYVYSIADSAARKEIKKDLLKHYIFYKKVLKWQTGLDVDYRLKNVPIIPKLLWANRARYLETENGVLTLKYYKEFVDRIDNLERSHALLRKYPLQKLSSLQSLAASLEGITGDTCVYRSTLQNLTDFKVEDLDAIKKEAKAEQYVTYFNKKRSWDGVYWLNYQWAMYRKKGFFRGDCGTYTTMQMSFYRAAGIPPVSLQYHTPGVAMYTHNFPAYYNPFLNKWDTVQKPAFRDGDIYFQYSKPKWHHRYADLSFYKQDDGVLHYGYYQGEKTRTKSIVQLLSRGITDQHFSTLFLSHRTMDKGLFFNAVTAPAIINDRDGDGIADEWEKQLKYNLQSVDSDGDGYADLWELEHGSDANNPGVPGVQTQPLLDGLLKNEFVLKGIHTVYSPQGDGKSSDRVKDIKSLSAMVFDDTLYLGATFYNDISGEALDVNSVTVLAKGSKGVKKYWVQWSGNSAQVYELRELNNWKNLIKHGSTGLSMVKGKDMEFSLPLRYFPDAKTLHITYHTSGYTDDKVEIISESSRSLLLDLKGINWTSIIRKSFASANKSLDEQGDVIGTQNIFDIKSVSATLSKSKLIVFSEFHNDITYNSFGYHTLYIHSASTKSNWWFQFWSTGEAKLYSWKDGAQSKRETFDLNKVDMLLGRDFAAFILSRDFFKGAGELSIVYKSSAIKRDGSLNASADASPKYLLKQE